MESITPQSINPVYSRIAVSSFHWSISGITHAAVNLYAFVNNIIKRFGAIHFQNSCFRGKLFNSANIGKSEAEIMTMWNEAHPEDPIETTP